jgi:enediyne biosynthesis protein E4
MTSRRRFLRWALASAAAGNAWLSRELRSAPLTAAAQNAVPAFVEIPASSSGITWIHENAMSPARFLPESLGPGCAFLDYDGDGWMDIYLVNSGPSDFFKPATPLKNALYRNNRDGTFTDVTDKAGVAGGSFGMGVAVGDFDNDGFPDMFVTGYGRSILYRNNGNGTFSDVTEKSGLSLPGVMPAWTTSAVWFDYDNDGRLDLFVGSYVEYKLAQGGLACAERNKDGSLYYHYCIPHLFKPTPSALFHNNGDGTFHQVSGPTTIGRTPGKALGAVATDIDNDGQLDLVVANDTAPNFLFLNRGRNTWRENGVAAGIAYSGSGNLRSGMGVDAGDFNGDGWQDLFVANIDHEMFSLYENHNGAFFTDAAPDHGLPQATRLLSGWGAKLCDFDNDGFVDLLVANGHPDDTIARRAPDVQYKEPLLLFRHDGRRLRNVSQQAGPVFAKSFSARGLAVGDYDNDGRVDVLVGCNGEAPVLLRNTSSTANHWVGVRLQGVRCNRDAIGARLAWSVGGVRHSRQKNGGGSYLSSHDPREVLGLGRAGGVDWLEVTWPAPSSKTERFANVPVDRYLTIVEGKGIQA